jgi:hypothetical protein
MQHVLLLLQGWLNKRNCKILGRVRQLQIICVIIGGITLRAVKFIIH